MHKAALVLPVHGAQFTPPSSQGLPAAEPAVGSAWCICLYTLSSDATEGARSGRGGELCCGCRAAGGGGREEMCEDRSR